MPESLDTLEGERRELLRKLNRTGDMRRGTVVENYRRCGKENCCCAGESHPGHGPYYAVVKTVGGKTQTLHVRPGPKLTQMEREIEEYRNFRKTCDQLVEVSETICDTRPVGIETPETMEKARLKKKLHKRWRKNVPRK